MIPPALFEVVQNISEGVLDHFKGDWGKEYKFYISTYQSFKEPT